MKTLRQIISEKKKSALYHRQNSKGLSTDPRLAHDDERTSGRLNKEIEQHEAHLRANEEATAEIERIIRYMESTNHQSPHRMLALRHLEDASMRLQRESGPHKI